MFIAELNPVGKLGDVVASTIAPAGFPIPTAITVMNTAPTIEMNDTMLMYETFLSVRGNDSRKKTTSPTTPHTIVQVACPVIAFQAIVKVKRWLPRMKIRRIIYAQSHD